MSPDSISQDTLVAAMTGGSYNHFDLAVVIIVLVSAGMSFGRGLIREIFSILAFVLGAVGSLWALREFYGSARETLPEIWPDQLVSALLLVAGFLIAYALASFCGRKCTGMVRQVPEMGLLDRIGGAGFGGLRGFMIVVFLLMGMQQVVTPAMTPAIITEAGLYQELRKTAHWVGDRLPGIYQQAIAIAPDIAPPIDQSEQTKRQ